MSVIRALQDAGEEAIDGIRGNLKNKGLQNTGRTGNSLDYTVSEEKGRIVLEVTGAANLLSLEGGASPIKRKTNGKFIDSIAEWAESKLGLSKKEARGLAFGYLRKRIGDGKGGKTTTASGSYFVPNPFNPGGVISDTVNEGFIQKVNRQVLKQQSQEYIEEVAGILKKTER